MKYAPSEDRKGRDLHPGDRVRLKLHPRGTAEGVVVISPRVQQRLPDGSYLPALAVDVNGRLFGIPSSKSVLKLSTVQKIATPQDLQAELHGLLTYCQSEQPSRGRLAAELRELANRVVGPSAL